METERPALNRLEILRSLIFSNWDAVFATVQAVLVNGAFQTGFARWLGAGDIGMGVLTAVPTLAGLAQLPAPLMAQRWGERKWFCAWFSLVGRLLWVPILLIPLMVPRPAQFSAFILLFLFSSVLCTITVPAWMSWMSDLVPPDHRGRYFGRRNMLAGITSIVVSVPAGWYLDLAAKRHVISNFTAFAGIFGLACVAAVASFACLIQQKHPPMHREEAAEHKGLKALVAPYRAPFGDEAFRRFMTFGAVFAAAQFFAAQFFTVYQLEELRFSYTAINIFAMQAGVISLVSMPLWGYLSDKFGHKPTLAIGTVLVSCLPAMWNFASGDNLHLSYGVVFVINVAGGLGWAAVGLAQFNMLIGTAPPEKKAYYVGAWSAVVGLAGGVSPIVGGLIMRAMPHDVMAIAGWHATKYHILFLLNTALRLSSLAFLGRVEDPRSTSARDVLVQLGGASVGAWWHMRRLQRGPTAETRTRAAQALRNTRTSLAVEELIAALSDPSLEVREEAVVALGEIGDPRAVAALLDHLDEPGSGLSSLIANALGAIGDERAVGALRGMLKSDERPERLAAVRALGAIGGDAASDALAEALRAAREAGEVDTLEAALEALGQVARVQDGPLLAAYVAYPIRSVKMAAVRALGRIAHPATVPPLVDLLLTEESPALLAHAAAALGAIGDRAAIPPLLETLTRLESPVARRQILHAVGGLMGEGEALYPLLALEGFDRDDAVSRIVRDMARREKAGGKEAFAPRRRARLLDRALEQYLAGDFSAATQSLARIAPPRDAAPAPCRFAVDWAVHASAERAFQPEEFLLALVAVRRLAEGAAA